LNNYEDMLKLLMHIFCFGCFKTNNEIKTAKKTRDDKNPK